VLDSSMTSSDKPEKAGGRVVLWLLAGLVLLCGGLYVAAYAAAGDNVPRGTTVSGVDIGGHPQSEAAERLERGLAERVDRPIEVVVGGETLEVDPDDAGLAVDYDASVAEAGGGRSWHPQRLWNYFTDGDRLDAVVTVDQEKLGELVTRLDKEHGRPAREGAVRFKGSQVVTTDPRAGRTLEADAVGAALSSSYLARDRSTVGLELVDVQPEIDARDVARAREEFANRAVASGVTLSFQGAKINLEPAAYTPALSLAPVDGTLEPRLDRKKLTEVVESRIGNTGAPVDATVVLEGGRPKVVPARPGVTYDRSQVRRRFLDLVDNASGRRTLKVKARVAKPDFTTAEARDLGIEERVSTFTTYYPHAEYRNVNLGRAAELIDGTVLKPGETFSLNGIVGERTRANGFTEGYIISDGILTGDLGGGVSQMATTAFNAMFFAGLEDVEHKPHSFYIDRYPIGREATVAWGYLDLKFRNDTRYGVLVDAAVNPSTPSSSGSVTVSMYSTKVWDISARTGERHNFSKPEVRRVDDVTCHANEGYGGFDINVWRDFRRAGSSEVVRTEKFHTTYTPSDTVICTNPDAEDNIG